VTNAPATRRPPLNRRIVLRVLGGIAVSAVAVFLVARSADLPSTIGKVAGVDLRMLALPVAVIVAQMWVRALRWAILLRAAQPYPVSTREALWPTVAGYLGNTVLPARAGEIIRIVLISRRTPVTATAATASVLIERIVDILALLAFAAAAYGPVGALGWLPLVGMLVLLAAFGLGLRIAGWLSAHVPASLPARLRDVAVRFLDVFHATRPTAIVLAWLVSLVAWLLDAAILFLCARALGIELAPAAAVLLSAGGALGGVLPAASASFGTYELGAITMAGIVGIPVDQALQVSLMSHVLGVVSILVMGVIGIVATSIRGDGNVTEGESADPASEPESDQLPITTAAEG
jgi:glycosyltransferase 2 family protein